MALYLESSTLILYLKTSEEEQLSVAKIEQHLREAYTEGEYTAFAKLGKVRWTEEWVDKYVKEVWRLAVLSHLTGEELEKVV